MANTDVVLQGVKDYTLELLGTKARDEAVDAADRAEAQAERAEAAADNAETGIRDDTVAKQHLTPGLRDELDGKADQQAVADNIATAQRSFRVKLRKVSGQDFYWLPVDLPTSLKGANEMRVMLPAKATWRLTAQGVAGISLRGVRNGAAARTKPLADDDFVGHWVADADDWLLFSFPDKTPEDGTEIEVSLYETDAFKADQEAVDAALALKADRTEVAKKADEGHTHKSSDITDTVSYFGSESTANRLVVTNDDGQLHSSRHPVSGNHLARKSYVDDEVAKKADTDHTHTAQDVGAATPDYVDSRIQLVTSWPASPTPGVLYLMEEG